MASYTMHLAIAKQYLKTHTEEDRDKFIKATIDVDNVPDKAVTHYSFYDTSSKNAKQWLKSKVNIKKYVDENSIKTSYERGYFLHLLTDYYFYNCFFDEEMLINMPRENFRPIMYNDYDIINKHLIDKYCIEEYEGLDKRFFRICDGNLKMMTQNDIDIFIEFASKLDINKLYESIKESKDILYLYKEGQQNA